MMIQSVSKGKRTKTVTMLDTNNYDDVEVLALALTAARETKTSIFGHSIERFPTESSAIVFLYTD